MSSKKIKALLQRYQDSLYSDPDLAQEVNLLKKRLVKVVTDYLKFEESRREETVVYISGTKVMYIVYNLTYFEWRSHFNDLEDGKLGSLIVELLQSVQQFPPRSSFVSCLCSYFISTINTSKIQTIAAIMNTSNVWKTLAQDSRYSNSKFICKDILEFLYQSLE